MYKEKISIQVSNNINRFIDKCILNKIDLLNVKYIDEENIIVDIYLNDLDLIKRINYYSDIVIVKRYGRARLFLFLKRNMLYLITIIFCFLFMSLIENVIFDVKIIHSNKNIINLVSEELKKNGIKALTFAKNYDELEGITLKIIENNPKKLEWMSITRVGMKYIVRVEERIITDIEKSSGHCHIVAKKDGLVKNISSTSGEILIRENDYVKKGDILVSGEIHLYDEVKANVCAEGRVLGEVWYTVNLSIPLTYQEKEYTENLRYNFILNNKKLFKEKYEYYDQENIYDLNILGFNFKYYKELEYKYILKKYSVQEAIDEGLKQVDDKFLLKLKQDGSISYKKILKKTQFDSRIDIEVFVVTLENIGERKDYVLEGDNNDI